jgi:SAM-dependent methyltransferase
MTILSVLRSIRNRVRIARERRRYHFSYSREFYEQGYHDKLHDVGGDDLSSWEARGYKERLSNVLIWVDRTSPGILAGRHLEVACMYGKTAFWLAEHYPSLRIDAFDFSERFVNMARAHNPFPDRVVIRVGDLTAIEHPASTFDSATCIDVAEHLPDQVYRRGLAELARVIKAGGYLLLMQGNTIQVEHIHILPEEELVADVVSAEFEHVGTYVARDERGHQDFFHLFKRA